jgi:prolyl 4-hydroxylase
MSVESALAHLRTGTAPEVALSVVELQTAARDGDAEAPRHLATLAAAGIGMPQSWARALSHLFAAAMAGSASARGQLSVLSGSSPPVDLKEDTPAYWRMLCATVRIEDWLQPCEKQVLRASPRTVAIEAFLKPPACQWLIGLANGRLAPALTYDVAGRAALTAETRGNSAVELGIAECDVVVLLTRQRMAATIGVPLTALEPSQILHYATGEQFALHHDYLDPALPQVAEHGQRIVTFLVYLNDGFEGGETDFPQLGLRHRGQPGDALYFGNLDANGSPDPRTIHAGLPPTRGCKWLLSQWIRDRARI